MSQGGGGLVIRSYSGDTLVRGRKEGYRGEKKTREYIYHPSNQLVRDYEPRWRRGTSVSGHTEMEEEKGGRRRVV